jgi:hypothetical protein
VNIFLDHVDGINHKLFDDAVEGYHTVWFVILSSSNCAALSAYFYHLYLLLRQAENDGNTILFIQIIKNNAGNKTQWGVKSSLWIV